MVYSPTDPKSNMSLWRATIYQEEHCFACCYGKLLSLINVPKVRGTSLISDFTTTFGFGNKISFKYF